MSLPFVRLLFVGEDEDDFVITRARLRDVPGVRYDLERACTFDEALEVLMAPQPVDVCLIEQEFEEMDALDLVEEAVMQGCRVPFIVLVDLAHGPPDTLALPSGAALEFLNKEEITPAHLSQTIRYAGERARMMSMLLDREERLQRQQQALLDLATLPTVRSGDLASALAEGTRIAAETLSTGRCEVWLFDDEGEVLTRAHAHANTDGPTIELPVLRVDSFPEFFKTLSTARIIVADEPAARTDTHRLYIRYLKPRGVRSALFSPLRLGDQMLGMIGCEHTRGERQWALDEQNFLSSISDLMSLVIQSHRQRQVEAALQATEERYALAAVGANDGLWDWVVDSPEAWFSTRWKDLLGFNRPELLPDRIDTWFERLHPDDRKPFRAALKAHIQGRTERFESEHRLVHRDGQYRWYHCRGVATRDEQGRATRIAGSLTDVTARRTVQDELVHEIFEDRTTGLLNRAALIKALAKTIHHRPQEDAGRSLFGLMVVGFESDGELVGRLQDRLSFAVAQRLESLLRPGDQVARIDSDQFGILLNHMDAVADAGRVGERIRDAFSDPFELGGRVHLLHPVIGVALSTSGYRRPEDYLSEAERAMERAMEVTEPTYAFAGMALGEEAHKLMQLEAALTRAVRVDAFEVMYQPVLSLHSRRIVAVEALLRWSHPEEGLLEPESFLEAAEETGLIEEIDRLVLRRACRTFSRWATASLAPPQLYVNVSARSITAPGFVPHVLKILDDARMDPQLLRLELSEAALLSDFDGIRAAMKPLYALGVSLNIDDFGQGPAPAHTLDRLPVDAIKIDGPKMARMSRDPEGKEGVAGVVSVARRLGRRIIAEHIETRSQFEALRGVGCDHGQGLYFASPQDIRGIEALLDPWRR